MSELQKLQIKHSELCQYRHQLLQIYNECEKKAMSVKKESGEKFKEIADLEKEIGILQNKKEKN